MSTTIHLDELIGVCNEISTLSKVGLPLEKSLSVRQGKQLGERLRQMANALQTGQSLVEVIRCDPTIPPFYAAVIEAGLESGNLSGVLDTVVSSARQIRDARLFVIRATLYPVFLFTLLWFILAGILCLLIPAYPAFFQSMWMTCLPVQIMEWLGNHTQIFLVIVFIPPAVLWFVYLLWGYCTKRSSMLEQPRFFSLFHFIPWLGVATAELRKATFAQNMAILVEAAIPLDRAIELAAQSCGAKPKQYAPLIHWAKGIAGTHLVGGLQLVAQTARMRAKLAITKSELFLPAFATITVAVALGLAYFFVIQWPYLYLFYTMSNPITG